MPASPGAEIQRAVAGAVQRAEGVVKQTESLAIVSLALGIASFVLFPVVPAIVAIVFGMRARERIRATPGLQGDGMALAGIIIGWVNIGLIAFLLLFIFSVVRALGS